jgi:molecular chaperone GrpE
MEAVVKQLESALANHDVVAFGVSGDAYDPMSHEIAAEEDGNGTPGTIARVLRRGWKLRDRVIRPAHVTLIRAES